jgi:tetratricopeptide (TPR) repeat protein
MARFLTICMIAFYCGSFTSAQNSRAHLKAAEQFIVNGYYEEAINQYNLAVLIDPQNGEAYESRAKAYLHLNKLQEASADFERAAVFGFNTSMNFFKSAEIQFNLHHVDLALEKLDKAIEQDPNNTDALILQYNIYFANEDYKKALETAEKAVNSKATAYTYFLRGKVEYALNDLINAEQDFDKAISKDKNLFEAFLFLAQVEVELNKAPDAIKNCDYLLQKEKNNPKAYFIKGLAFKALNDPIKAISEISTAISLDSLNTEYLTKRGECFYNIARYQEAINDFTSALNLDNLNFNALEQRAHTFEKISKNKEAASDYALLLKLTDNKNPEYLNSISIKIYKLCEEKNKPVINIVTPTLTKNFEIPFPSDKNELKIKGVLTDESKIRLLRINNDTIINNSEGLVPSEFDITLNSSDLEFVAISATDIYNNTSNVSYSIARIETHPPVINLLNPYGGDNNIINLSTNDNFLYLEGKVSDESLISSIRIDELNASYVPSEINPRFTATIDISQKTKIKIVVSDINGNLAEKEFQFVRDGRMLSEDSPMGKTWAILIENSEYKSFSNLRSVSTDIEFMQKALDRYKINNVIVKKNLTKRELERFFSIDLRDLVRTNHVNSLLIWFAGHGNFINGNGYWIPVDALVDDEFSYYNINALKASLYSYNTLDHLLLVSDACYTGSGFCLALRAPVKEINCSQSDLNAKKSAQVFTSSGSGKAFDTSLFSNSFGNSLLNNENNCISIEEIVKRVTIIMQSNTQQNPEFGTIIGLKDEEGTFLFISR